MVNAPINLEVCDALYELNQFEKAKAELHNNKRVFTGNKTKAFEDRLIVVCTNQGFLSVDTRLLLIG